MEEKLQAYRKRCSENTTKSNTILSKSYNALHTCLRAVLHPLTRYGSPKKNETKTSATKTAEGISNVTESSSTQDAQLRNRQPNRTPHTHPVTDIPNTTTTNTQEDVEIVNDIPLHYKWAIRGLKAALWLTLLLLFSELQFGSVFFIISMFYFVYKSLGNRTRKQNEPSAYSVFNPNCERLDGTFTSDQFEKQMFRGGI